MFNQAKRTIAYGAAVAAVALTAPVAADAALLDMPSASVNTSTATIGTIPSIADDYFESGFRWVSGDSQNSVMSHNYCSDYGLYVSNHFTGGVHDWKPLGAWVRGDCIKVRGRSTAGSFTGHAQSRH